MRKDIAEFIRFYPKGEMLLLNKSEIARRFNCDPRTVDRYLEIQKKGDGPERKKREYSSILDDYKSTIINKVDVHGATAMAVYRFIVKKGYTGKHSIVARFVNKHKANQVRKATIRFETTPGLQAQVDWKEEVTMISKNGEVFKVNIFLMVLGFSRMKYVCLTSDRTQETLFRCLMDAILYFGGVPHEILFDNMKTVVNRSRSTFTHVELNQTFSCFARDAGFKPITCRAYRPQTKGKVEALAKFTNRLVVYNEEFKDYKELDGIVNSFRDEVNDETSQATDEKPIERFEREKEHLLPIPNLYCLESYLYPEKVYTVYKDSMIKYGGKRYSTPTRYIGSKVTIRECDDGNLCIYYSGDCIACHPLEGEKYNYTHEHASEILRSDVCRGMTYSEVDEFIDKNLSGMDIYLGGNDVRKTNQQS